MDYILITGAGSGIGKAIAEIFDKKGFPLILCGRNSHKLESLNKELQNKDHIYLSFDQSNLNEVIEASKIVSELKIKAIIANAGLGGENYFGNDDRWLDIVNTNLNGTYYIIQSFLPQLKNRNTEFGSIIITSSVLARLGVKNYTAYCASKAGLLGLMRSLAIEHAENKILVNAIAPGWVNTDMAMEGMDGIANHLNITRSQFYDIAMQSVPLKKMSEPQEIAELVNYLVQQKSITGQTIDINNGSIMNS